MAGTRPAAAAAEGGLGGGAGGEQTTVFVRGLPTAATEIELRSVMSKFGPLKACRCPSRGSVPNACPSQRRAQLTGLPFPVSLLCGVVHQ